MPDKRLALKDIAEQASVSAALVSNILNGKGRASQAVREKIINLLEENGYKPRYKRRPIIYFSESRFDLDRDHYSPHNFTALLSGIAQQAIDSELNLMLEFNDSEQAVYNIFDQHPSGILINAGSKYTEEIIRRARKDQIPVVQVGYDNEDPSHHAVIVDSYTGAYQATQYLIEKGHERIACIRWGMDSENSQKKFAGFTSAMNNAGVHIDVDYIVESPSSRSELPDPQNMRQGREAIKKLLALDNPPTAVFVDNNFISLPIIFPLKEDSGLLPQQIKDLEIVHFGDIDLRPSHIAMTGSLNYDEPSYTYMRIDWNQIGRSATQLLLQIASDGNGKDKSDQSHILRISPSIRRVLDGKILSNYE